LSAPICLYVYKYYAYATAAVAEHAHRQCQNLDSQDGNTALIYAAANRRSHCVRLLVEAGADKNAKNQDGHTALIRAASKGRTESVRLLVQDWANKSIDEQVHCTICMSKISIKFYTCARTRHCLFSVFWAAWQCLQY
jgi:hypothetical protein